MEVEVVRKRFTVDEYYRLVDIGILNEDSRVELIEGDIIEMPAIGHRHLICVNRGIDLFVTSFRGRAIVSPQNPVQLSDITEPQPDIALLKHRADFYAKKRIWPKDVLLFVEIADTTLAYDLKVKLPLYAKAGVPEFWIEDLQHNRLLVFRDPAGSKYRTSLTLHPGDSVSVLAFPEIVFRVEDLLLSNF